MDKDDARKLSPAEQHERRRQVVRAHQRGRSRSQIAAEIGLSHTAVSAVLRRYQADGMARAGTPPAGSAQRRRSRANGGAGTDRAAPDLRAAS